MQKNRYAFSLFCSLINRNVALCVCSKNNTWCFFFFLVSSMRTNPIKPFRLPRMGCCRARTCPPPQKRKRKIVPRRWMSPSLRVGGKGVPPWHPKPGSSRSTGSYSSRRWRIRLRNWPTREDLAPASNLPIQFLRKAKVSAGFASCVLAYVFSGKSRVYVFPGTFITN